MNKLCTPRDWQLMAQAKSLAALEQGDFHEATAHLAESKRYGACADQIGELHEQVVALRAMLREMCAEFCALDLPCGSKAYARANELLIALEG